MKILLLVFLGVMLLGSAAFAQDASPRILIAYFSKTNTTRTVAETIRSRVGGDIFQVTTSQPYPQDYRQTTEIARTELDSNARPRLAATIDPADMRNYDVIFLGYPNWWGTIPMVMFTFLEQYDLSGKAIIPFCTHGGSGLGRGPGDIGRLAPGASVRQGLAIRSGSAGQAGAEVDGWLRQLGLLE